MSKTDQQQTPLNIDLLLDFMRFATGKEDPSICFLAEMSERAHNFGRDLSRHGLTLTTKWKNPHHMVLNLTEYRSSLCDIHFEMLDDDRLKVKRTGREFKAVTYQLPDDSKQAMRMVFEHVAGALPENCHRAIFEKADQTPQFADPSEQKLYDIAHAESGPLLRGAPVDAAPVRSFSDSRRFAGRTFC